MKKVKKILFIFLVFILSCSDRDKQKAENDKSAPAREYSIKSENPTIDSRNSLVRQADSEVFDVEQMLFNGKMKRFMRLNEFKDAFGEPDSIKLLSEVDPCTFIFDNTNGTFDVNHKYLYKDGSCFENYKDSVAINEFRFYGNNFLKYKNVIFNSSTTVNDLKRIFPKAMKEIGPIDVHGEGKFQMIRLREDETNISEGKIFMFIKNNKLYFMHWWFPC